MNQLTSEELAQQHTLDFVLNTVNTVSLIGAMLVVTIVAVSSYFNCNAAKRLSFRLSMWIALADAIFCGISYLNLSLNRVIECNLITAVGYISNLTYIFLTVGMAYNLQMVFVKQQHNPRLTEKFYAAVSFLAAFVIILPFTVIAVAMDQCTLFQVVDLPYNLLLFWLMIGVWELVGILYCAITIVKVVLKLTRFHGDIGHGPTNTVGQNRVQTGLSPGVDRISDSIQTKVERVVRRLVFYPLVPVITQTPYIIASNISLLNLGRKPLFLKYIYYVPSYSAGFLNAMVFLFDPALPEIANDFKTWLIDCYYTNKSVENLDYLGKFKYNLVYKLLVKNSKLEQGNRMSKVSQSFFNSNLLFIPQELLVSATAVAQPNSLIYGSTTSLTNSLRRTNLNANLSPTVQSFSQTHIPVHIPIDEEINQVQQQQQINSDIISSSLTIPTHHVRSKSSNTIQLYDTTNPSQSEDEQNLLTMPTRTHPLIHQRSENNLYITRQRQDDEDRGLVRFTTTNNSSTNISRSHSWHTNSNLTNRNNNVTRDGSNGKEWRDTNLLNEGQLTMLL